VNALDDCGAESHDLWVRHKHHEDQRDGIAIWDGLKEANRRGHIWLRDFSPLEGLL
jgi:hypothetical protein